MPNNQPVGVMQIVLTSNNASFSAGIAEAQRKLDAFGKTATGAGHSTVSSMQAASASIRLLENPLGNNIRSIERLVSQSKFLADALKVAFPFVGAIAGGMILAKLGADVVKFIKTVEGMPKAIKQGFDALHLSAMSSDDALRLTNDQLQNSINKLQGKPQNNLAIAIDEARLKADDLAKSLENDMTKVKQLLDANKISMIGGVLTNQGQTAGTSASVNVFQADLAHLGSLNTQAVHEHGADSPEAAKTLQDIKDKENAYSQWLDRRIKIIDNPSMATPKELQQIGRGDQAGNRNIVLGAQDVLKDSQNEQSDKAKNAALVGSKEKIDAAREASARLLKVLQAALEQEKVLQAVSIKQEYDYWTQKISLFSSKSAEYDEINKARAVIAAEGARQAADAFKKARQQQLKGTDGEGDEIVARAQGDFQRNAQKTGAEQNQEGVDSNQLSIVNAQNDAREKEARLTDEAGRSISKYAAAVQVAQVHAQEFLIVMASLQSILSIRQRAFDIDPSKEGAKQVESAHAAISSAQSNRNVQIQSDADNIYGRQTSAAAGAADALRDFTLVTNDAHAAMLNFINSTQSAINEQIVRAVSGQRTDFGNAGASIFRNVANMGLQKAEGSVIGLFTGKKTVAPTGAKGDPIYVQMAAIDAHNAANAGAAGLIQGVAQAGSSSSSGAGSSLASLAGLALKALPMFAGGGAIGADQWAIVGEEGPELFHSGGGGMITPNSKLRSVGAGGGHTFNIDATGSTDPAQVDAAVRRGIAAAAPHLMAGSVKAMNERQLRRPSTSR